MLRSGAGRGPLERAYVLYVRVRCSFSRPNVCLEKAVIVATRVCSDSTASCLAGCLGEASSAKKEAWKATKAKPEPHFVFLKAKGLMLLLVSLFGIGDAGAWHENIPRGVGVLLQIQEPHKMLDNMS